MLCMCATHLPGAPSDQEKGTKVTESCEPHTVGTGNWSTSVLDCWGISSSATTVSVKKELNKVNRKANKQTELDGPHTIILHFKTAKKPGLSAKAMLSNMETNGGKQWLTEAAVRVRPLVSRPLLPLIWYGWRPSFLRSPDKQLWISSFFGVEAQRSKESKWPQ